ncbi:MAG: amidohydrolase family protein, partial [bacterium]|nr:amidohydrolase family protein [bacterium]
KTIEWIQSIDDIPGADHTLLDCSGKLVMKSFACGHHHIYSALARGMGAPQKIPGNFYEILKYIWWTLDKCLDMDMIQASALVTALYCAKNGVTFVIDHHASPFAVENSLQTIASAFDRVGVSHLLCYELSDRDGEKSRQKGLEESENYLQNNPGLVGLHASFTVGNQLLEKAVVLAGKYNSGIHVHAAEDQADQDYCLKDHQIRVIERFSHAGVLSFPKTILAHCLHLTDDERQILKQSPVYIAQNTDSNLNNNVGFFHSRMLKENNIMLGTDGMYSDMLRSAKAAFLVGQGTEGISLQGIYSRFRNVHHYIRANKFAGDGDNNLVVLDYDTPTVINRENFYGHFIYGIESSHIESVISNGRLIVKNRKILTVNESEILTFSKEMG